MRPLGQQERRRRAVADLAFGERPGLVDPADVEQRGDHRRRRSGAFVASAVIASSAASPDSTASRGRPARIRQRVRSDEQLARVAASSAGSSDNARLAQVGGRQRAGVLDRLGRRAEDACGLDVADVRRRRHVPRQPREIDDVAGVAPVAQVLGDAAMDPAALGRADVVVQARRRRTGGTASTPRRCRTTMMPRRSSSSNAPATSAASQLRELGHEVEVGQPDPVQHGDDLGDPPALGRSAGTAVAGSRCGG